MVGWCETLKERIEICKTISKYGSIIFPPTIYFNIDVMTSTNYIAMYKKSYFLMILTRELIVSIL